MTQSQPGADASNTVAYRKEISDLLGDRKPLDVLMRTADELSTIAREHSTDRMRARPFPGKWTANEIIGHLLDAEWVFGFRMRMVLCQDRPTFPCMDQELWVVGQRHNEREPVELIEALRGLREPNLALWRGMSLDDLKREGQHDKRGPESLETMLGMCAGHDLSHLDQIRRYLAASQEK